MTLRTRLLVAAGLVLVMIAAIAAVFTHSVRNSLLQRTDVELSASLPIAQSVAAAPKGPPVRGPAGLSGVYIARLDEQGVRQVLVRPLASHGLEPRQPVSSSATPTSDPRPQTVGSVTGSGEWRAVLTRATASKRLLVAIRFEERGDVAGSLSAALHVARLLVLSIVAMAGWWLLRLGLRPIVEVTRTAEAITSGDRSRRVAEGRPGTEAAELARAFNLMLDAQNAAEARLRRFVADASHELRTPVTAIGGFADLYRHGGVESGQLDEVMRRIGQESARMRDLVADMLLLARLDDGATGGSVAEPSDAIDLVQVATDAVADAAGSHPSRTLTVIGNPRAPLIGDEARIRQVIANLVTNALIHTEGSVEIAVTTEADMASIEVIDEGPGLGPTELEHAFDRFWRGNSARTRTGSGLGLPIVRGIVAAHGGTVTLTGSKAGGTTALVRLPLRKAPLQAEAVATRRSQAIRK